MPRFSTKLYTAGQARAIKDALSVSEIDDQGVEKTRPSTDDEVSAWLDSKIIDLMRRSYVRKESAKNAGVAAAQAAGF